MDVYPSLECSRGSDLAIKAQIGEGKVGAKGGTDGDQADPPKARDIERCLEPVRVEDGKG